MNLNYTNPKLYPVNRDVKKSWFVGFRYTNTETGERRQFQFRGEINIYKTKREKLAEGNALISELTDMLSEGWNPFNNETEKEQDRKPVYELLDELLEIKKTTLKIKSFRTYSDAKNILQRWMVKKNMKTIMPAAFTTKMARSYADYLLIERKYSGKTFNGMIGFTKIFFNMMIERELIEKNPFAKIKKEKHDIGKNHAFTASEKKAIINRLKNYDPGLYCFVSFMYHCFIRRSELVQLLVSDVDHLNRTITINSSASKNRKQESVSIPEGLWPVIQDMNLENHPGEYYIFGHGLTPGPVMYKKPDLITAYHKEHLKELKIPAVKTLYSWKHTGVCDYFQALKDPYVIMRQLRHHDLSITMIYLKSLGLTPNIQMQNANIVL